MQHWTQYWASGHTLHSFAESGDKLSYKNKLHDLWCSYWAQHSKDAKLLDIGTGNGALALAMLKSGASCDARWDVSAIDLANIQPERCVHLLTNSDAKLYKDIHFFGRCSVEKMPFIDAMFDGVYSQFGLEYAAWERSLPEIHRVLKPGGQLIALMHLASSPISQDCKVGIHVLEFTFDHSDIFQLAHEALMRAEFLLEQRMEITRDSIFQRLNQSLLFEVKRLQTHFSSTEEKYWFEDILSRVGPLMYTLKIGNQSLLLEQEQSLRAHLLRLKDQHHATLDDKMLETVGQVLNQHELLHNFEIIYFDSEPFAVKLRAIKKD